MSVLVIKMHSCFYFNSGLNQFKLAASLNNNPLMHKNHENQSMFTKFIYLEKKIKYIFMTFQVCNLYFPLFKITKNEE